MAGTPTVKVRAEYYVLWDDHTWEDGRFHEVTVESGDDLAPSDDDIQAALRNEACYIMAASQYRRAVLLVPVAHEVLESQEDE